MKRVVIVSDLFSCDVKMEDCFIESFLINVRNYWIHRYDPDDILTVNITPC